MFGFVAVVIFVLIYVFKINNRKPVNWFMAKNYIITQFSIVILLYSVAFFVADISGIREMYLTNTKHLT